MFHPAKLIPILTWAIHAAACAQDQPVTPKEIQDTWVARSLLGTTAKGVAVTMKIQADGSASLQVGTNTLPGTWRVSDNGYCTTWKTNRGAQENCFTARRSGDKVVVSNLDGSVSGYFTEIR